jgi:hypothetical protein
MYFSSDEFAVNRLMVSRPKVGTRRYLRVRPGVNQLFPLVGMKSQTVYRVHGEDAHLLMLEFEAGGSSDISTLRVPPHARGLQGI